MTCENCEKLKDDYTKLSARLDRVIAERDAANERAEREKRSKEAALKEAAEAFLIARAAEQRAEEAERRADVLDGWREHGLMYMARAEQAHKWSHQQQDAKLAERARADRLAEALREQVIKERAADWSCRLCGATSDEPLTIEHGTECALSTTPPEQEREEDAELAPRWLRHAAEEEESDDARDALLWAADTLEVKEYLQPWARKKMGLPSTPTGDRDETLAERLERTKREVDAWPEWMKEAMRSDPEGRARREATPHPEDRSKPPADHFVLQVETGDEVKWYGNLAGLSVPWVSHICNTEQAAIAACWEHHDAVRQHPPTQRCEGCEVVDCLRELVALVDDAAAGVYDCDGFTTQPAKRALTAHEERATLSETETVDSEEK